MKEMEMYKTNCIVCNFALPTPAREEHDSTLYDCRNCGPFELTGTTICLLPDNLQEPKHPYLLSHAI